MAREIDRKKLWGRSGSRCALCNVELTELDGHDVIVGDEAHIRSAAQSGPRHDPAFPTELLDHYGNLILLCKAHHKLVDTNSEVFPADVLDVMKRSHEMRVSAALSDPPSDWVRQPEMRVLRNGTELFEIISGASGFMMSHDHPPTTDDAELVGELLQDARDWGEIAEDIGAAGGVEAAMGMDAEMNALHDRGWQILGGRGAHRFAPNVVLTVAVIRVVRLEQ